MKGVSAERLKFMEEVAKPMLALEGDLLPVSVFSPGELCELRPSVCACVVMLEPAHACTGDDLCV